MLSMAMTMNDAFVCHAGAIISVFITDRCVPRWPGGQIAVADARRPRVVTQRRRGAV
jgi:hypothetical protein